MDPYYKKMMLWLAAALFASIAAAFIIVEFVVRTYGSR
jgi:signal peptidase I